MAHSEVQASCHIQPFLPVVSWVTIFGSLHRILERWVNFDAASQKALTICFHCHWVVTGKWVSKFFKNILAICCKIHHDDEKTDRQTPASVRRRVSVPFRCHFKCEIPACCTPMWKLTLGNSLCVRNHRLCHIERVVVVDLSVWNEIGWNRSKTHHALAPGDRFTRTPIDAMKGKNAMSQGNLQQNWSRTERFESNRLTFVINLCYRQLVVD